MNTVYAFQDVLKDFQNPSPWFQEFLRRDSMPSYVFVNLSGLPTTCLPSGSSARTFQKKGKERFYPLPKLYQNCDCHVISI